MDFGIGTGAFFIAAEIVALTVVLLMIWIPLKVIFHLGDITQEPGEGA